jgi:hypothetical protein
MTSRQSTPRQDPLPPDVGFSDLVTQMITTNRHEQAERAKARRAGHTALPEDQSSQRTPESPLT